MPYNSNNKNAERRRILEIYNRLKQSDIPDTQIVSKKFPEFGIFISRATWCKIKGMKPSELGMNQLSLFE